jgi:hypothetical protein
MSHFHHSRLTKFIQIHSTADGNNNKSTDPPLEVTSMHMLFIVKSSIGDDDNHDDVDASVRPTHSLLPSSDPVPAHYIKVGDIIQSITGPRLVTNIATVQRHGLYNPITTDGTIVVDGIIASTYSSYTGTSHIEVPSFIDHSSSKEQSHHLLSKQKHHSSLLSISFHAIASMAYTPYRAYCTGSLTSSQSLLLSMATTTDTKNEQRRCNSHEELANVNKMMKSIYTHTWENGSLSSFSGPQTTQKNHNENKYNDFITVMKKIIVLVSYLLIFGSIHFAIKYNLGIMIFITMSLTIFNVFYHFNEKKTSMMKVHIKSLKEKRIQL